MKRDWLYSAATAVLVLCAVTVTALVVRREMLSPAAGAAAPREAVYVEGWRGYAASGHRMGSRSAPVTLVIFSDFQCPACRALAGSLREVRAKHPNDLAVVFRHFPLPKHPLAVPAVHASECAAEQGRFEQFHDAVFERQDSVGVISWRDLAAASGVRDLAAFDRCLSRGGELPALSRDTAAGNRLGVRGTPTLLINGKRLYGAPSTAALEEHVAREVRAATTVVESR
jgi:protein-disulfide isomerase